MKRATTLLAIAVTLTWGLLVGCSGQPDPDQEAPAASSPQNSASLAEAQQVTAAPLAGYQVSVPKLHLANAPLVPLGLNPDHTIQVPPLSRPRELGVYTKGPMPGANGPAVILGHVNSGGTQGAFADLSTLQKGDEVDTVGPGGPVKFQVYKAQVIAKGQFPTKETYSDTPGPELRLITCGGELDASQHNYLSNVIVWAKKV